MLATLLGACVTPEKLNSDRIRERFGNYGIAIVSQDLRTRRASLYSTAHGRRTARTEALVVYEIPIAEPIVEVHRAVVAGASIGETFRDTGWQVQKKTAYIGETRVDDIGTAVAERLQLSEPTVLAMHVYELHFEKDGQRVFYATVVELHHPDYLTQPELRKIYSFDVPEQLATRDVEALAALVLASD